MVRDKGRVPGAAPLTPLRARGNCPCLHREACTHGLRSPNGLRGSHARAAIAQWRAWLSRSATYPFAPFC